MRTEDVRSIRTAPQCLGARRVGHVRLTLRQGKNMITISIMIIGFGVALLVLAIWVLTVLSIPVMFVAIFVGFLIGRLCAIIKARITEKIKNRTKD